MNHAMQRHQSGAALFVALMFLIIITTLSLAAMRSSVLELRMAGNHQMKNTAFQRAQAVVDATVGNAANMPTLADVDATNCMASDPKAADVTVCTSVGVVLDEGYLASDAEYFDGDETDGEVYARVTRLAPLEKPAPRSVATSAAIYSVATYQVESVYDLAAVGQGKAHIREGLMLLISK